MPLSSTEVHVDSSDTKKGRELDPHHIVVWLDIIYPMLGNAKLGKYFFCELIRLHDAMFMSLFFRTKLGYIS